MVCLDLTSMINVYFNTRPLMYTNSYENIEMFQALKEITVHEILHRHNVILQLESLFITIALVLNLYLFY